MEKYELAHDILAIKIKELVPEREIVRQRVLKIINDRFEAYDERENKVFLNKKELEFIQPYRDVVNISDQKDIYIEKSLKAVQDSERKDRRRLMSLLGASVVALLIISISLVWVANTNSKLSHEKGRLKDARDSISNHKDSLEIIYNQLQSQYGLIFQIQKTKGVVELEREHFKIAKGIFEATLLHANNRQDTLVLDSLINLCDKLIDEYSIYDRLMNEGKNAVGDNDFEKAIEFFCQAYYLPSINRLRKNGAYNKITETKKQGEDHHAERAQLFRIGGKPKEAKKEEDKVKKIKNMNCK